MLERSEDVTLFVSRKWKLFWLGETNVSLARVMSFFLQLCEHIFLGKNEDYMNQRKHNNFNM